MRHVSQKNYDFDVISVDEHWIFYFADVMSIGKILKLVNDGLDDGKNGHIFAL